jgi:hypothetical protein
MINHVLNDESLTDPGQVLLMLVLADCHNPKNGCYPSIKTLSRLTRYSESFVCRLLNKLVEIGKLFKDGGGGRGKKNRYVFCYECNEVTADCLIQSQFAGLKFNGNTPVKKKARTKQPFKAPSLAEFKTYASCKGIDDDDAEGLFNIWEAGDWHDSKSNPIKNWKQKLITYKVNKWLPSNKRPKEAEPVRKYKRIDTNDE